jgi:flagellar basal body-associated protein FliL
MPVASRSEFYFIAAMMVLILVLCVAAVYAFFRTYKKEMRAKRGDSNRQNSTKVPERDKHNSVG